MLVMCRRNDANNVRGNRQLAHHLFDPNSNDYKVMNTSGEGGGGRKGGQ
jgi:hypothetical protein